MKDTLMPGHWTTVKSKPQFSASTMLLLNDGSIMCHDSGGARWFLLTPDSHGDYVNGSWSELAPMANTRLYYGSAVLRDGRVVVFGGEYSNVGTGGGNAQNETNACEIYNPLTDTWTKLDPPVGWANIGDTPCVVLPDGRVIIGNAFDQKTALFDPETGVWTPGHDKLDLTSEESWVLLPDGSIIVAQCANAPGSERYLPGTDQWVDAGTVPVNLVETSSREIGPGILTNNGRALFVGATGNTAVYTPGPDPAVSGTWTAGPHFPLDASGKTLGAKDAPGCLLPNGRVLLVAGPVDGISGNYTGPTSFFEFDGVNLIPVASPVNAGGPPFVGRMLIVPTGQVLFTAGSAEMAVYSPDAQDGVPHADWRPTVTLVPTTLRAGGTATLFGTQLNGRSQAVGYGDDSSAATNYPLVCLRFSTGNVVYCRTFNHSTMGVATGTQIVSTSFQIPPAVSGSAQLSVIVNGIESNPQSVFVNSREIGISAVSAWQFLIGSLADGDVWGWGPHGPIHIGPWGPDLVAKAKLAQRQMISAMKSLEQIGILAQNLRERAAASLPPAVDPESLPHGQPCHPEKAIRIARIHPEVARFSPAGRPAQPQLTYRGGDLMTDVQVASVFWGATWQHGLSSGLVTTLNEFLQFIVSSPLIDQLAEYNTPTQKIRHGTFGGTTTVLHNEPAAHTTDDMIRNLLRNVALNDPHLPRPSANTLYCVFTPRGVKVQDGADSSCTQFCGYHNAMDSGIFYAVLPYPGCRGCLNGHFDIDSLTITASHEICEAITDPVPGAGWYDDNFGEIGDIDNTQVKRVGQFLVQKEWSNQAGGVV